MSIFKRDLKSGRTWRTVVRSKGHPTVCATFSRKQEAVDWERNTKQEIKSGRYHFLKPNRQKHLSELIDRYIVEVVQHHHKASADTKRHLAYFKKELGDYALVYITPELLLSQRKNLMETPTYRET